MATGPAPKCTRRRTALIAARVAAGYTQETLAARIGVERSTVYRWEAGLTVPLSIWRPGLRPPEVDWLPLFNLITTTCRSSRIVRPRTELLSR